MNYTFVNTAMKPGQNVFANMVLPDQTLSVGAERKSVTRNSIQKSLVRTSVVLTTPERVGVEGCTDNCADTALFTRAVRVETSGLAESKTRLIEDLQVIITFLESHDDKLLEGFLPPAANDITIVTPTE